MESQTTKNLKKVILTDDHDIVRHAIRTILESTHRYEVVAESDRADETVELIHKKNPDLVILDIGLPNKSGLEVVHSIKRKKMETKVIILSMYNDEIKVKQAYRGGAHSYLLKNFAPKDFLAAVDKVMEGEIFIPECFAHLSESLKSNGSSSEQYDADPLAGLSPREREMFYFFAEGMPNRVIAQQLMISPRTVETHRARVIKKLGFKSNADLIRYAIRSGLIVL